MCFNNKPAKIPPLPAMESEEDKFRKLRQEQLANLKGRQGRSATILSSPLGDSQFGSNTQIKQLGGQQTSLGGGVNRADR